MSIKSLLDKIRYQFKRKDVIELLGEALSEASSEEWEESIREGLKRNAKRYKEAKKAMVLSEEVLNRILC